MRAAVCRACGPPESIEVGVVSPPVLADGQVRVRVRAAAVNYPDVLLMARTYQVTLDVPFVPGSEFAGVVAAVSEVSGTGSDGCAVGDRVWCSTSGELSARARQVPGAPEERAGRRHP